MPDDSNQSIGVVLGVSEGSALTDSVDASDWASVGFQPGDSIIRYRNGEPEYVGTISTRTEPEDIPIPPDRDSQDNPGVYTLQAIGISPGEVIVANSWGSPEWMIAPNGDNQSNPQVISDGMLSMRGGLFNRDIIFYTKDGSESLRIGENGDFFVQGRLVKNDLQVYHALRVFLGLALGMPPDPESREGVPTRYERILKGQIEGQ